MQTVVFIVFCLVAALIVGSAAMVVTVRNVIHSALWLISTFFGVGALYLLLEAEFVAVIQVLIYVGAVSILILFAIMLTKQVSGADAQQQYGRWWVALLISVLLFGAVIVPTVVGQNWNSVPPTPIAATGQPSGLAGAAEIGVAFMREYLIPFEIVSVLLLVALIGAIVVASDVLPRRRRIPTLAEEFAQRNNEPEPTDRF